MNNGGPAENIEWTGLDRWHCYLHLVDEKLVLLSHGLSQNQAEIMAFEWLQNNEPPSSCHVVTSKIVESVEVGDFIMRGPTP